MSRVQIRTESVAGRNFELGVAGLGAEPGTVCAGVRNGKPVKAHHICTRAEKPARCTTCGAGAAVAGLVGPTTRLASSRSRPTIGVWGFVHVYVKSS